MASWVMFWDVVPTRAAITAWGQPDRAPFGAQLDASVASLGQFEELESPRLIIRTLQSRWAGLSPSGTMTLNVDLVRAPRTCIEYVVVHEICHLKHPHHGAEFYRLLDRVMPDWEKRKERLEVALV